MASLVGSENNRIDADLISALSAEAVRELSAFRSTDVKKEAKNLAKKVLGRAVPKKDDVFWPAGMLLLGLMESGHIKETQEYVDAWIASGSPAVYVDDALTGYTVIRLYEATGDERYKTAAAKIADFLLTTPKDAEGSIIYGPGKGNEYIYADGCGMTTLFLSHFGKVFAREDCTELAAQQLRNFLAHGMDERSGLPYHGFDLKTNTCLGIIGWGRAVGWFIMGLAGFLADQKPASQVEDQKPAPQATDLRAVMDQLIANIFEYLREDKLLSWQLQATKGPLDTSATGMIGWAVAKYAGECTKYAGECKSSEPELLEYEQCQSELLEIASALLSQIKGGKVMGASAECIDFAEYRQAYGNYPWGQGAVLAFYSILREMN